MSKKEAKEEFPFITAYGPKPVCNVEFKEPSRTVSYFKKECDINEIVNRWMATGVIDHQERRQPKYIDCIDPIDYQEAMDVLCRAEEQFDDLPVEVRDRFHHDPLKLLEFVDDDSNYEEAVKLGLVEPKYVENPDVVNKNVKATDDNAKA
jgi:phage internal scaffolding protein